MKYLMYSVFDSVTSMYAMPFYCVSHAEAVRSIVDFIKQNGFSSLRVSDSSLVFLGEFDSSSGVVSGVSDLSLNVTFFSDILERYGVSLDKVSESV